MRIRITDAPFSPERELAAFSEARAGAGACVSFVGLARAVTGATTLTALELQHYPGFTEAEIERITDAVCAAHALIDVLVLHRVGKIARGDAIVLVAALSIHRAEAFAAVEKIMDYLKTDAPFWKREWRGDGEHWIEPTPADRARRARHEKQHP